MFKAESVIPKRTTLFVWFWVSVCCLFFFRFFVKIKESSKNIPIPNCSINSKIDGFSITYFETKKQQYKLVTIPQEKPQKHIALQISRLFEYLFLKHSY